MQIYTSFMNFEQNVIVFHMIGQTMLKFFVSCLVIIFFLKFVSASGFGKCPKQQFMNGFNMTKFTGRWYEVERTFHLIEVVYSCVTVEMSVISDFKLNISVVSKSRWSDVISMSEGFAVQTRRDPTLFVYKVHTKLPRMISKYLPGSGVYQIIDTDYKTYAILWSCSDYIFFHTDMIWILGREKELNVTTRTNIYRILEHNELDPERLTIPKGNCM